MNLHVMSGAAGNQLASANRDPRRNVEINVGKACNNKCVFCLDGMPSKEDQSFMSWQAMRLELERYSAAGHRSVGFLGGEPTMYPKIAESIAYARELGFSRIALATNAMMFRRQPFVDKLIAAGLTRVTISMHGHTAALEDRLTDVPGAFEKKCIAIEKLREARNAGGLVDGLSANIVLNGWNYQQLPKMMRFFFEDMDLADLRVNFVRPEGYAVGSADLTPTFTEVAPILRKAILLNELYFKRVFTVGGVPLCTLPGELLESSYLRKKYLGDVFYDLSTDCSIRSGGPDTGVSKVEGGRARFNWQDRKRYDLKHHPAACSRCDVAGICEGIWQGYVDIYGAGEARAIHVNGRLFEPEATNLGVPRPRAGSAPIRSRRRLALLGRK